MVPQLVEHTSGEERDSCDFHPIEEQGARADKSSQYGIE